MILTTFNNNLLQRITDLLSTKFAITDLGILKHFLGVTARRTSSGLFLSQEMYAKEILERENMSNCKPASTPVETGSKLSVVLGAPLTDRSLYRSLAGTLQYLTFTRPDSTDAVQQVCLFMHVQRESHLEILNRILCYLKGTIHHGLYFRANQSLKLTQYTYADSGGCPDSLISTSGYCVILGDNLISRSGK
ncbi:uncharacterized mitochondrial protein AtMg00810-like [Lactuca sativa]|uniref:uncharacterized mitochondrial protein AtMg00810-like n=1 Tax=Lactuca sativa TaxID=4236 RepID=UPI0022AF8077|nr:uncharacterized mitochondrial protein AtMg00810-like [Lactuca sativa]